MNLDSANEIFSGKLITLLYEDHEIEAIVIDPDGLGKGKPSIGMGLGMTERHVGIAQSTLSRWTKKSNLGSDADKICMSLKLPSGKELSLMQITDENNREQLVIEASDWVVMASDVLKRPGKTRQETLYKLVDFLVWYAAKGVYAECYTKLFGVYTSSDDKALTAQLRQENEILKSENEQLSNELALTEHHLDRMRYQLDSVSDELYWKQSGCPDNRDLLEDDDEGDADELLSPYLH